MSEKTNETARLEAEAIFKEHLNGDALKNALDFDAYMRESGMPRSNEPAYAGSYGYHYLGECVCVIAFPHTFWNDSGWSIHTFDILIKHNGEYDELPVDDHIKELVWENMRKCLNECGCGNPGHSFKVYGKEFNNYCFHTPEFKSPNSEEVKKIVEYMQTVKLCIDNSQRAKH